MHLLLKNNLLLQQMDVVTAFLNGTLEEDIYMQQADGYLQQGKEHLVFKLKKSLYGLKQSPWCWNKVLAEFLTYVSFVQSSADPYIYVQGGDCPIVVAAYVDGLIIAAKTKEEMQQVKQLLQSQFVMTDIEELHYCLGIVISYVVGESIELHQKQYIEKMLKNTSLRISSLCLLQLVPM